MMDSTMKHRFINIKNMKCMGCGRKIKEALKNVDGIQTVRIDSNKNRIEVTYDLLHVQLKDIERLLEHIGYPVQNSFMNRMKDYFLHFSEKNERDNISAPLPACCSDTDNMLENLKHQKVMHHVE